MNARKGAGRRSRAVALARAAGVAAITLLAVAFGGSPGAGRGSLTIPIQERAMAAR